MTEFFMGALGFLACAAAFFAGSHYGARDRPVKETQKDAEAEKKAEAERKYTANFYSYTGDQQ